MKVVLNIHQGKLELLRDKLNKTIKCPSAGFNSVSILKDDPRKPARLVLDCPIKKGYDLRHKKNYDPRRDNSGRVELCDIERLCSGDYNSCKSFQEQTKRSREHRK